MLAIRLQRLGRKAYPVYRVAVQEAQRHPSSGRVVAYVGSYNPHTKDANINVEAAQKYLDNGAQPSSCRNGLKSSRAARPKQSRMLKSCVRISQKKSQPPKR